MRTIKHILGSVVVLGVFFVPTFAQAALTTNLVSYYQFEGNPNDDTGTWNGTNGGGTGPAYSSSFGKILQGVKSVGDGAGFPSPSYITTGNGPNLTGDFSISFWMRNVTNAAGFNVIYSIDSRAGIQNGQVEIYLTGSTAPTLSARAGPSSNATVTSTTGASSSTWHHYVFVRDGTNLRVYGDGTSEATSAWSTAQKTNLNYGAVFFAFSGFYDNGFTGEIDEFGIWSRALTAAEVTTLYNGGAGCANPFNCGGPSFNFWQFLDF